MEQLIKQVRDMEHDLVMIRAHAEVYRKDADRGLNVSYTLQEEGYSKERQIEHLINYLADAKNDFDRLIDEMKDLEEFFDSFLDEIDFERVRLEALSK